MEIPTDLLLLSAAGVRFALSPVVKYYRNARHVVARLTSGLTREQRGESAAQIKLRKQGQRIMFRVSPDPMCLEWRHANSQPSQGGRVAGVV